ncbi:TPA: DUF551 domain-containing protein [Klebsiella pneumoniae]|nr:DUF551 domain-containing protein [Klebsiella pneumoniae]
MTKSTITRERLQELAEGQSGFNLRTATHEESQELARMALAAMDSSESVELPLDYLQGHKDGLEWAAQLAEANHPETGDWLYDDPIELAKAIRKGPDMPPAQPAPVVQCPYPCGWDNLNKLAIQDAAFVAIALVEGEPAKESIRQAAITNNDRLLKVISACRAACRAAMLAAAPQSPGSEPATVPGKWIPVSERMPDNTEPVLCIEKRADFGTYGQPFVCWHDGGGWVGKTNYRPIVTHWMPLPAAPQEVK